jgi:hypothetical protein
LDNVYALWEARNQAALKDAPPTTQARSRGGEDGSLANEEHGGDRVGWLGHIFGHTNWHLLRAEATNALRQNISEIIAVI